MMYFHFTSYLFRLFLLPSLLLLSATTLTAQFNGAPDLIPYQGFLATNPGDNPVPDATYSIVFTLYDAASGGTTIWSETQNVTTSEGGYNVLLGQVTSLADVAFDQQLWLGIKVETDPEMVPRTALGSVPYALSLRNMRITPETATTGPNVIGGSSGNNIGVGVVGATISGGGRIADPNQVTGSYGTIGGGRDNTVSGGLYGTISGGQFNATSNVLASIGGGYGNAASGEGTTISGGSNHGASGEYSTISGGAFNESIGNYSTVGGGDSNYSEGSYSTVSGGYFNQADGQYATIPGGRINEANGDYSFAAGRRAHAEHDGTFVWADDTDVDFASTATDQFLIRAGGGLGINTNATSTIIALKSSASGSKEVGITQNQLGGTSTMEFTTMDESNNQATRLLLRGNNNNADVEFYSGAQGSEAVTLFIEGDNGRVGLGTTSPGHPLVVGTDGANGNGAYVTNGGTWTSTSSRSKKTGFEPVAVDEVLEKVASLPVLRWQYKGSDEGVHMGPMAEDFYVAFGLGTTDRAISMVDADGVALAAIQGLYQENQELKQRIAELERLVQNLIERQ